jgi:triphosphatase
VLERRWAAIMRALGEARDWDVFCASLEAEALGASAELRRGAAQLKVRELLRSPGFRAARRRCFDWSQGGPWRRSAHPAMPLRRFAADALQRLHGKLRDEARGIDWRDAARRHRVRIRVKRLRYACDFFASQFPGKASRRYVEALRTLQDVFGEMNDADVQRRLLRRLVPRGSPLAMVRAEAAARAGLAERERELVSALEPAWTAFERRQPFWQRAAAARARG